MKTIVVGKIVAAHGVKGLVKILPFCEDVALLEQGDFALSVKNKSGKYVIAAIEDVQDRDAAEALKGAEIVVSRGALPDPEEGHHYIEDLVGLSVVEDGTVVGEVLAVRNYGASDLLDIRLQNGQSFYLPMTDDYLINIADVIAVKNHKDMILD